MSVVRTGTVAVALPPDAALELFTAPGETRWVPGWSPTYVDPPDGTPVEGGIWTTEDRHPDGTADQVIWRVQRFDRAARIAEYLRIVPGNRVVTVSVRCDADGAGTRATISYAVTALSRAGEAWLAAFDDAAYSRMMDEWQRLLAAYLATR